MTALQKRICFFGIALFIAACSGEQPDPVITEPLHPDPPVKMTSPETDAQYVIGDVVEVKIEVSDPAKVNGLQLYVDDTLYQGDIKAENQSFQIDSKNSRTGFVEISIRYADDKGEERGDIRTVVFFSDITPVEKKAVKKGVYPHDVSSYTQGLEFYKGVLYEGTGQKGQSILAEVDLVTGKKKREHSIPADYFGEGITILNDTIYQITWQTGVCMVYDLDFNLLREMNYTGEGWGLCNDGKSLIMSDGSHKVVWRNPRTFEIEKEIHVFDNDDSIEQLNELELINGRLYANVYGETYIVEIDPATGKVLSKIDCSDIAKEGRVPGADVLNGIAVNTANGKIYLTGKWWPKLFEVTFE